MINNRFKEVRKALGFSQKEFALKLGMTQSSVSWNEQPHSNIKEHNIKMICSIFNVNENWLRTGEGQMFVIPDLFSLDKFIEEHGMTALELELVKTYFEIPFDIRKEIMDRLKNRL